MALHLCNCRVLNQWALADAVLVVAARPVVEQRLAARRRAELYPWSTTVRQLLEVHAGEPALLEAGR